MKSFFALCLFCFAVLSGAAFSSPAQASILNIQEVISKNGVKAWLVEDHSVPVVSLQFMFKGSGAVGDGPNKSGLSRMLSNTLDEGAGPYSSKDFQSALTDNSISLSFSANRDDFGGSLKTLTKNKAKAFELLALSLTQPRFDQEAIDRMRAANLTRIKSDMTSPDWLAARMMNALYFEGHPYAANTGGTLSSLAKITASDLRAKMKTSFARDRLIVSVAGDIRPDELADTLDRIFSALPQKAEAAPVSQAKPPQSGSIVLYKKNIPQTVIEMVAPGIRMNDPDYFAAEVMNYIFGGGGFGSRLTETVREKNGLTYGIYSDLSEMDYSTQFSIASSSRNEAVSKLLNLTTAEMTKMSTAPITDKELADAKAYLIGSVALGLTSTDKIAGSMMAFQRYGLPKDFLDVREAAIRRVTKDAIYRTAKKLLTPANLTIFLVGNPTNIENPKVIGDIPGIE